MDFPPGTVLKLHVVVRPAPKEKYLVVVADSDPIFALFINSKVNAFYNHGIFGECNVAIDQTNHGFLRIDSFIDCNEIRKLPRECIINDVSAEPWRRCGTVSKDVQSQIVIAVKKSPCLTPDEKRRVEQALQP